MHQMLVGAIATASLVVTLFFLRYWKTTGDRFFLYFALSFGLEGLNRIIQASMQSLHEEAPAYYLVRLVAYGLILLAIWEKNRLRDKSK